MENEQYPTYTAKQTLCLCYSDIDKPTDLSMIRAAGIAVKEMPLETVINKIYNLKMNLKSCLNDKNRNTLIQGSYIFPKGVFKIFWSNNKQECDDFIDSISLEPNYKLVFSQDKWTIKEFADMIWVMSLFASWNFLGMFLNDMEQYIKEAELPFEMVFNSSKDTE